MGKDIAVGEEIGYYGYPIKREEEGEYRVSVYADDFSDAKTVIKRCLEAGIICWPSEVKGRTKKEGKNGLPGMDT